MGDERVRELERSAQRGDPAAVTALARERGRRSAEGSRLDQAHACLAGDDPQGALSALLAAWAQSPATELAEAIEALSERVVGERSAIPGGTRGEVLLASDRLLRDGDAFDLPRAIRSWGSLRCGDARALFPQIQGAQRDPRVSAALLHLCQRTPSGWAGKKHLPFWRLLLGELVRHGDPRAGVALGQRLDGLYYLSDAEVATAREAIPAAPTLSPVDRAALHAFRQSLAQVRAPTSEHEELLRAVYDDPHADAPREALAAALEAARDERGEFIRLQLERASKGHTTLSRREAQLERVHRSAWLGSLDQLLGTSGRVEWERGLPAAVFAGAAPSEPLDPRAVRSLRRLGLGRGPASQALFDALPAMPERLSDVTLDQLEAGVTSSVVDLATRPLQASEELERVGACRQACPRLRALSLPVRARGEHSAGLETADLGAFWDSPLGAALEHVWIRHRSAHVRRGAWGVSLPSPGQGELRTLRVTGTPGNRGGFTPELIYHRPSVGAAWQLLARASLSYLRDMPLDEVLGPVQHVVLEGEQDAAAVEPLFSGNHAPRTYR